MSLKLCVDTIPDNVTLHNSYRPNSNRIGANGGLNIGDYFVGNSDMEALVWYWLTNSDLVYEDSRVKLIERIKNAKIEQGYNGENSRRIVI